MSECRYYEREVRELVSEVLITFFFFCFFSSLRERERDWMSSVGGEGMGGSPDTRECERVYILFWILFPLFFRFSSRESVCWRVVREKRCGNACPFLPPCPEDSLDFIYQEREKIFPLEMRGIDWNVY